MEYLTCLNGHRHAADKWRRSEIDPACLFCPVCSEVVDTDKPTRRAVEGVAFATPPGRRAIEVMSLIAKLKLWVENRTRLRLESKDLKTSIKYLCEYRDALVGDDLELGKALDLLADSEPRDIRVPGKLERGPNGLLCAICGAGFARTEPLIPWGGKFAHGECRSWIKNDSGIGWVLTGILMSAWSQKTMAPINGWFDEVKEAIADLYAAADRLRRLGCAVHFDVLKPSTRRAPPPTAPASEKGRLDSGEG